MVRTTAPTLPAFQPQPIAWSIAAASRTTASTSQVRTNTIGARPPSGRTSRTPWVELLVRRDFDQIAVGITAIDRDENAERAVLLAGPFLDGDTAALEMVRHLLRRRFGQEAEIVAAGRDGAAGEPLLLRCRLGPQVDLLPAEMHRGHFPAGSRLGDHALHAEHALVPGGGDLDVLHVDDEVIEGFDGQGHGSELRGVGLEDGRPGAVERRK